MPYNLITILGPTASGKTSLAAHLALKLGSGVISADSRQVYKGMDVGTGKDITDYNINGVQVPYYLIDIKEAGQKYNLYEFQKDFFTIFQSFLISNKTPIMCGGSGLYIESVLEAYNLVSVPVNDQLRIKLELKTNSELELILANLKPLHNKSDLDTRKRTIRAIEIAHYQSENTLSEPPYPEVNSLLIGIAFERDEQRKRITERLKTRLQQGLIEEVRGLLDSGIPADNLVYYGLEYKFVTKYLLGETSYDEMFKLLNIAIHQFSKRQMTWFRKMEREGYKINWIDGNAPLNDKINKVLELTKPF